MSTDSDRLLVQRIREQPRNSRLWNEAWGELYRRYQGRLTAYVRRRLKDQSVVDDLVQLTFLGFQNSLPNYDDRRDLQTWLFTIAAHKVTDQLRSAGRRPTPGGEENEEALGQARDPAQRGASSLARSAERREREEDALGDALRALVQEWTARGEYRSLMVLELLLVKGWGNKDAAAHVGVSEQQVANLKFQAKKRLARASAPFPDLTAARSGATGCVGLCAPPDG